MKQCYVRKKFTPGVVTLIDTINDIIAEYKADGYVLTVRQLYYQLVAKGIIPNTLNDYKRIASVVNDGKLAGLIDWDMLEDRTREFVRRNRWNSPAEVLDAVAKQYHEDMWQNQSQRLFLIVEKEALVGVLDRVCNRFDVPLLAARGYPSGSVLREFARDDVMEAIQHSQTPVILHLGDHDPSGIDMTRDLRERIELFTEEPVELIRIALTMEQIHEENPPENPAKATDSRFRDYKEKYGDSSWELDALNPAYLDNLVTSHIQPYIDDTAWEEMEEKIKHRQGRLKELAKTYKD